MRFDLSAVSRPLACAPCEDDAPWPQTFQAPLQISFGLPQKPVLGEGLVRRSLLFGKTRPLEPKKCTRADDDENDQYTIRAGRSMCWSVLFRNDTGNTHPNSLLGDYGHVERLSAWIHLVGGIAFLLYAIVRPFAISNEHTIAESAATAAAGGVAFAFLSSSVYHVTAPSKQLAFWTRQLDYVGIYLALALGYVADFAIATHSFENVSVLSVVDGPIACLFVAIFFFIRRTLTSTDETWDTFLGGCTLSFGLMRKGHLDLEHTGTRQSTSFLLGISYFVTIPSLYSNFGSRDATVIFLLELSCLALLVGGMLVDNLYVFPDVSLSRGRGPKFLACTSCGCIGTSHSIWHAFSVVAAMKGAASREFALSLSR